MRVSPIQKVVDLLSKMLKEVEERSSEEEKQYTTWNCWAAKSKKDAEDSNRDATQQIEELGKQREELTARRAALEHKIKTLVEDTTNCDKDLDANEVKRQKEAEAFGKMSTDLAQSIGQLKGAISALSKGNTLAQMSASDRKMLQVTVAKAGERYSLDFAGRQLENARSFLQAETTAGDKGEIVGVLKQLLDDMEKDLASATDTENLAAAKHAKVSAELAEVCNTQHAEKSQAKKDLAEAKFNLSSIKTQIEELEKTVAEAVKLINELEAEMKAQKEEMQKRKTLADAEKTAIKETKEILTDSTSRGGAALFLQTGMKAESNAKKAALEVLKKSGNPKLQLLAVAAVSGAFDTIIKEVKLLRDELKKEQKEEALKRDFCNEQAETIARKIDQLTNDRVTFTQQAESLEEDINSLQNKMEETVKEIETKNKELTDAGILLAQQSEEKFKAVGEIREAKFLLEKAHARLEQFYGSKESLLQQAPPKMEIGGGTTNSNSGGALNLIKTIHNDLDAQEKEHGAELQELHTSYANLANDVAAALKQLRARQNTLLEDHNKAERTLQETNAEIKKNFSDLEAMNEEKKAMKKDCDFLLANFVSSQESRNSEIDALQQVEFALKGAVQEVQG